MFAIASILGLIFGALTTAYIKPDGSFKSIFIFCISSIVWMFLLITLFASIGLDVSHSSECIPAGPGRFNDC